MEEGERQAAAATIDTAEVALRSQVLTARQHKAFKVAAFVMTLFSLYAYCYAMIFKATDVDKLIAWPIVQLVNQGISALNTAVLGGLLAVFSWNLALVRRARLRWPRRKRVLVHVALAMLVLQWLNSVFFLVPNVVSSANRCSWYKPVEFPAAFIRWSCWNSLFCLFAIHAHNIMPLTEGKGQLRRREIEGQQQPVLVMDGTTARHLPLLALWCFFQASIITLVALHPAEFDFQVTVVPETAALPCEQRQYRCLTGITNGAITSLWIFLLIVYSVVIQAFLRATRRRLLLAPYKDLASVHLMFRQQKQQMAFVALLGVVAAPTLWYTRWNECNSFFLVWLGILPLQMIASTAVFVHAFYMMPLRPGDESLQHAWLQEFAWLEADCEAAVQQRAQYSEVHRAQLLQEPMFCFETAIKLLLWAELVYDFKEEEQKARESHETAEAGLPGSSTSLGSSGGSAAASEAPSPSLGDSQGSGKRKAASEAAKRLDYSALLQSAMQMYGLQSFEVIYEPLLETRVLLAWSDTCLVGAFRGTAGMANALSDAKAWRVPHPPARGQWWLCRQPLVHKGFLATWRVNGLHERVCARVAQIVDAGSVPPADFRVFLTGHSLGGALATLAATDLQRARRLPRLAVYTYGAPRTGNHAFAADYEALAPQTWHLINDRDAVPRSGKFVFLYKRPGQRTLINQMGDMRVRPTTLEVSIHNTGFSIRQHLMASYLQALWSICVSQRMPSRALPGGAAAIDSLAASPQMRAYFATLGLDLASLAAEQEQQMVLPALQAASAHCWGLWALVGRSLREAGGILRELLPISENAAATLSLMQASEADAVALQEARQASHLARRLHAVCASQQTHGSAGRSRDASGGPTPAVS